MWYVTKLDMVEHLLKKEEEEKEVKALRPDCAIKTMLFVMKRRDNFVIPLSFPLKGQINK